MSELRPVVIGGLLAAAVVVQWVCCVGVLRMRGAYNRAHFLGPATLLSPALIAVAVLVDGTSAQASVQAVMLALVLLITGPVTSHALARATRVHETGKAEAEPKELEKGEASR